VEQKEFVEFQKQGQWEKNMKLCMDENIHFRCKRQDSFDSDILADDLYILDHDDKQIFEDIHENDKDVEANRVMADAYTDVDRFSMELLDNRSISGGDDFIENSKELQCDVDHLPKHAQTEIGKLKQKYSSLFSRHKHDVGRFLYKEIDVKMDPNISCFRKQRQRFLPDEAKKDIELFHQADVFELATESISKYCANLSLVMRQSAKELKDDSKASKWLNKVTSHFPNILPADEVI
jgi:hypothetical protein